MKNYTAIDPKQEGAISSLSANCIFFNCTAKLNVNQSVCQITPETSAVAFNITCQVCAEYLSTKYFSKSHLNFQSTGDNGTKACRFPEFTCSELAKLYFFDHPKLMKKCKCLPDCTSIDYVVETTKTQRFRLESEKERNEIYNQTGQVKLIPVFSTGNSSRISIWFQF